jgi:hypothetical protein
VVAAIAAYAFLMWRASKHPLVDWGEVDSLHRLVDQVTQRDFRGQDVNVKHHGLLAKVAIRIPAYFGIVIRDMGLGAIAVAVVGAIVGVRGLDRGRKIFLAVLAALNLVAVVFVTGVDGISGFLTGVVAGGYILDLLIVMAVLVAFGTTPIVDFVGRLTGEKATSPRRRSTAAYDPGRFRFWVAVAVFFVVLVPSIVVHFAIADHRQPPLADNYAERVLSQLPAHAVLFVYQADLTFPLVYRQAVFANRPDVDFVITTSLQSAWYRDQLARKLHLPSGVPNVPAERQIQTMIDDLQPHRPVFVDIGMMTIFRSRFPYRLRGLVGEVVAHNGTTAVDPVALSAQLVHDDRADHIAGANHLRFPNGYVYFLYARAHIELAKRFAAAKELEPARTELRRALADFSDDPTTAQVLTFSGQTGEDPANVFRVIQAL